MKNTRVLPPTYLLAALLAEPALHRLMPMAYLVPSPWRFLGTLPIAAGIALNLWADAALKAAGTTVKPFQPSVALVQGSAYRWSRHPMYLGYVLILAGVALWLRSLSPWLVIPPFVLCMDRVFIRAEERMMREHFGQTYYQASVRRWI